MKIAITTTSFAQFDRAPLKLLEEAGAEVFLNPYGRKLTGEEVVQLAAEADGLIAGTEPLDKTVLEKLTRLKVISRCGVGMDNIDCDAAQKRGIKVCNTPSGPTLAVAELTVGLILNLLRQTALMDREMRSGLWKKRMGNLLHGKRVGVIGFGKIGQKTADLLKVLGCEICYCDKVKADNATSAQRMELEELLAQSDIVVLHVSGKFEKPLLGVKELALMKQDSWLVNTARGGVVDEEALLKALKDGRLTGAALDVFAEEPYEGDLKQLDNVILTPHIGSYAREARIEMEHQAAVNLLEGLRIKD